MIFRTLGPFVSKHWKLILAAWGLAFLISTWSAPGWQATVQHGEFMYLPPSAPSQVGESEYRKAFSHDLLGSTAVIVVRRAGRDEGLLPQDRQFVEDVLKPAILRISRSEGSMRGPIAYPESKSDEPQTVIRAVRTANDRVIGRLLTSEDGKTTLVLVEFTTRFLDRENWPILSQIETLIAQEGQLVGRPENLFARQLIPPGLSLSLSGPATVGRDLQKNSEQSTSAIIQWALLIGVLGLLLFYRAPFLALASLVAILVPVGLAISTLAHLAGAGWLELFAGLENYVLIVLAGAGLVSGLLFIGRDNEMRFQCPTLEEATARAIDRSGPAIAGGAAVLIVGWGMLLFAQYGKFQQVGAALMVGAVFQMLAILTLLPAFLVLLGRWAYWPHLKTERISADQSWNLPRATWSRLMGRGWSAGVWRSVYRALREKPRSALLGGVLLLGPFVAAALLWQEQLTYGLLSQLPENEASVQGAEIIQEQFPAGTTGPVTLLVEHPGLEFHTVEGKEIVGELSDAIERRKGEFGIADIRSVTYPLGLSQKEVGSQTFLQRALRHRKAVEYYVADKPPLRNYATKLEIVFADDPFSRTSIAQFENLRRTLPELLPAELAEADWHLLGGPANIRDLKFVTDRDRLRIQGLVIAGVFLCLWSLVRRAAVAAGLVGLGLLNFLASLGATFVAFRMMSPDEFEGLDWKVPTLLFVVLMSLTAQNYWLLVARIREEQQDHGPALGLPIALERTGTLFLAGGLIAAGVFTSLMGGALVVFKQFGFALAVGLLIDALVIRPVFLPAGWLLFSGEADEPGSAAEQNDPSVFRSEKVPLTKHP